MKKNGRRDKHLPFFRGIWVDETLSRADCDPARPALLLLIAAPLCASVANIGWIFCCAVLSNGGRHDCRSHGRWKIKKSPADFQIRARLFCFLRDFSRLGAFPFALHQLE